MTPKQLRDLALLRMVRRGQRMGLTMPAILAGTDIPVAYVKRLLAQPRPNPTQGKAR